MIHRLSIAKRRQLPFISSTTITTTTTTTAALTSSAGASCTTGSTTVLFWFRNIPDDKSTCSNNKRHYPTTAATTTSETSPINRYPISNVGNYWTVDHHKSLVRRRTTNNIFGTSSNDSNFNLFSTTTSATTNTSSSSDNNNNNNNNSSSSYYVPLDSEAKAHLVKYTHTPQTSVSLQTLMRSGRGEYLDKQHKSKPPTPGDEEDDDDHTTTATNRVLIQVAGFLRRELPIRLAHRIKDLDNIPMFRDMNSVNLVKHLYKDSFLRMEHFPTKISNKETEQQFMKLVEDIYEKHAGVLVTMARGAYELRGAIREGKVQLDSSWRRSEGGGEGDGGENDTSKTTTGRGGEGENDSSSSSCISYEDLEEVHDFLDRFYVARIGIRVLIGHYLALHQPIVNNYVGIICSNTSPYDVISQAIDDATFMCTRKYGDSPEVIISGNKDLTFPYVPTHLHYILLELLKNSMRATMDFHGVDADYLPPVKVVIADGKANEDVVIKISDEGGGIPRSNMRRIWSYLFTTADPEIQAGMVALKQDGGGGGPAVDHSIDSPLAGLGYGLPISRAYARYFGGDLSIMSMEGYGTDAFVYLTRLGNTREPLPI